MRKEGLNPDLIEKVKVGSAVALLGALFVFALVNENQAYEARQEEIREMCGEDYSRCTTESYFMPDLLFGAGGINGGNIVTTYATHTPTPEQ